MIKVNKPLAFFDLETTGVSTADDRIVSIAVKKYLPDGSVEDKYMLINPERPIPEGATQVHGISDEMVKDAPSFKKIAKSLHAFLEGCDLAGFNIINFDIPLLAEEFLRAGLSFPIIGTRFLDACTIYRIKEVRTLSAGYKFYCGKEMTDAHNAQADVNATCEVLEKQMELYEMDIDAVLHFVNQTIA